MDCTWNKTVTDFVNHVSKLIKDHKELTGDTLDDAYYIEKLNATFENHKDMSNHLRTLESQEKTLQRILGTNMRKKTYDTQLHEVKEQATTLDNMYKNHQSNRRANQTQSSQNNANANNRGNRNNNGGGRGGGRGNGGRGNGSGGRGGGRGTGQQRPANWMPYEQWSALSAEEKSRIRNQRDSGRNQGRC